MNRINLLRYEFIFDCNLNVCYRTLETIFEYSNILTDLLNLQKKINRLNFLEMSIELLIICENDQNSKNEFDEFRVP